MNDKKTKPCNYCGAQMSFIKTTKGNWMPVDVESVYVHDLKPGNIFVTDDGEVHKYDAEKFKDFNDSVYISHFATCPRSKDVPRKGR